VIEICTDLVQLGRTRGRVLLMQMMERMGAMLKDKNKFTNLKILQFMKAVLLSKDEELVDALARMADGFVHLFLAYRRRGESLLYSVML
jgi:hypothetical protein